MNKHLISSFVFSILTGFQMLWAVLANAQEKEITLNTHPEGNKIFVVVLVISAIFVGLILTLFLLERRIRKIENQINKH